MIKNVIKKSIFLVSMVFISLTVFAVEMDIHVVGNSMSPTVENGQIIRVPIWGLLTEYLNGTKSTNSLKGRLVIINNEQWSSISGYDVDKGCAPIIKRVVGVYGDKIIQKDGALYINGDKLCTEDDMPDGELFGGFYLNFPQRTNKLEISIGKDEVYVVGDNMRDSYDSRSFGVLETRDIIYCLAEK